MKMKTILSSILFGVLLTGCASTSFKSTWKNPDAGPVELQGKKVVVMAVNVQRSVQLGVEAAVSDELKKMGANAVSSTQILPPDSTKESAKARLEQEGFDAAFVIHATDKEQEVYSSPGVYAPYGAYGSFYGGGIYGGGWGMYSAPTIQTNTNYYVETLIYSVKLDQLAWSGLSVTTNPSNIEAFSKELTKAAIAQMKKTGLLK